MAGIGFELRRMLDERKGFLAKARAYMAAGLISSGPWLMTILTLTLLHLASPFLGAKGGIAMFRSVVTYCFAFSLILQGVGQMVGVVGASLGPLPLGAGYDLIGEYNPTLLVLTAIPATCAVLALFLRVPAKIAQAARG